MSTALVTCVTDVTCVIYGRREMFKGRWSHESLTSPTHTSVQASHTPSLRSPRSRSALHALAPLSTPHSPPRSPSRHSQAYFSQFGEVAESWLMYDPATQRPRGFGFVVFADEKSLNACLAQPNHVSRPSHTSLLAPAA